MIAVGKEIEESSNDAKTFYTSVRKNGEEYKIGECCYILPEAFNFAIKHAATNKKNKNDSSKVLINSLQWSSRCTSCLVINSLCTE